MNHWRICLCLLLCLTMFGCGKKAKGPQVKSSKTTSAGPSAPSAKSRSTNNRKRRSPRRKNTEKLPDWPEVEEEPEIAAEDLPDLFRIANGEANFSVMGPSRGLPSEQYAVVLPNGEANSTTFVATPPAVEQPELNPEFRLPPGYEGIQEGGIHKSGYPNRIRCLIDGSVMALVPAGVFTQGSDSGSEDYSPALQVYLDHYYIDIHEVTLDQYAKYYADRKQNRKNLPKLPQNENAAPSYPAIGIDFIDARSYAKWVGKVLPSEAEWEKAGRSEFSFAHPWGNGRAVWPGDRAYDLITPVMLFRNDKSLYGVYDLAGNAKEWTEDWYHDRAYELARAKGEPVLRNPTGPQKPSSPFARVIKGGDPEWNLWQREGISMRKEPPGVGFRCVWRIPQ